MFESLIMQKLFELQLHDECTQLLMVPSLVWSQISKLPHDLTLFTILSIENVPERLYQSQITLPFLGIKFVYIDEMGMFCFRFCVVSARLWLFVFFLGVPQTSLNLYDQFKEGIVNKSVLFRSERDAMHFDLILIELNADNGAKFVLKLNVAQILQENGQMQTKHVRLWLCEKFTALTSKADDDKKNNNNMDANERELQQLPYLKFCIERHKGTGLINSNIEESDEVIRARMPVWMQNSRQEWFTFAQLVGKAVPPGNEKFNARMMQTMVVTHRLFCESMYVCVHVFYICV